MLLRETSGLPPSTRSTGTSQFTILKYWPKLSEWRPFLPSGVQRPKRFFWSARRFDALFKALPKDGAHALRDRALLMTLYNTGARVEEVQICASVMLILTGLFA